MLVGHPGLPSAHWARFRAASRARDMPSALENLRAQFDLSPVDLSQVRHPALGSCCLWLGLRSRCDVVERGQDVVAIARGHNRALPNAQCVGGNHPCVCGTGHSPFSLHGCPRRFPLLHMATLHLSMGHTREAETALHEAVSIAQQRGDKACLSFCLSLLAQLHARAHNPRVRDT